MAGGQDAIYRMREAIRSGFKFANGGAVEKRGYAPAPVLAPARQSAQSFSSPVDAGALASAVASAVAGYQPMVQIDGRTFYGVMESTTRQFGKRR